MQTIRNIDIEKSVISDATLWEEDGVISFYFDQNTIIDAELVYQLSDYFVSFEQLRNKKSILLNLEGIQGATLEGLGLLNKKLDNFCDRKAILANDEKTDIIGRVFANSFNHTQPTKVFKTALDANLWMNLE